MPLKMPYQPYFVPKSRKASSFFKVQSFDVEIKDNSGKVYFSQKKVKAPDFWSPTAVGIAASKYFKKPGVHSREKENSVFKMVERVVYAIQKASIQQSYLSSKEAAYFAEDLKYILLSQMASFNSPVWFNCGIYEAYGISGEGEVWHNNFKTQKVESSSETYKFPQVSACFIQSIEDDLESIFELLKTEARIFKYGSGSGTNFSTLRSKSEPLASGGSTSGLMSFLDVFDRSAASIKSGGITRRAAKMVCVDVDHPEILDFINWKKREEAKAQALIGAGYPADYEGDAYRTVSGQNSNNSVRIPHTFIQALKKHSMWSLKSRLSGKVVKKIPAQKIWDEIIDSAWYCADPGLQFSDHINSWNTCKDSGVIRASNPCSEYMFLDDSACNLASLNLVKFYKNNHFDFEAYRKAAQILFMAQEILVDYAGYPTEKIAKNSHEFRPLGLGFCGLGALLMQMNLAYDSEEGRTWASVLSAFLHGEACWMSAQMAKYRGSFKKYSKNKKNFLSVMARHQHSVKKIPLKFGLKKEIAELRSLWESILKLGRRYGFRNAQMSLMAPTGTIGLLMDSETTGIEPYYSLLSFKKLAGGGSLKIKAHSLELALGKLGYSQEEIKEILDEKKVIKREHQNIFACAQSSKVTEDAIVSSEGHLKMMAAIQPFLSGAISKTVNLPSTSTRESVSQVYLMAWEMGLKAISIYRENSKLSQPLAQKEHGPGLCPECGGETELSSGCFRCINCGFTTGCVS